MSYLTGALIFSLIALPGQAPEHEESATWSPCLSYRSAVGYPRAGVMDLLAVPHVPSLDGRSPLAAAVFFGPGFEFPIRRTRNG